MERKEFTSGEAEPVEYGYRVPFYSIMELFIETLTGTCFELHVSPFETVISVKAKIQRLEGIPVSQQYLIWHNIELEDDYCLHDYSITDGCTLKLVLAMRGGPINTRRIAMDEPSFREMADYVDANQEELFENLSTPPSAGNNGSNKQVTLLVYRDGDQLNFFRVVDRGDGTLTPLSESLSGGSICNMEDEEDIDVTRQQRQWTVSQMIENNITSSKVKQLRNHMHNLSIKGSTNKKTNSTLHKVDDTPILPNASKDDCSSKLLLAKRQLSFSPKASRQMSLPPTMLKTNSLSLLGDIPSYKPQPSKVVPVSKKVEVEQGPTSVDGAQAEAKCVVDKASNIHDKDSKLDSVVRGKPDEKGDVTERSQGEMSDGEVVVQSRKIPVNEGITSGAASFHTTASKTLSSTGTITKAELLRARLNRIKQAMNKEEEQELEIVGDSNIPKLSKRQQLLKLEKSNETITKEGKDIARNRSPRTERLLAALSKNGKKETPLASEQLEIRPPATSFSRFSSSLTQGLAFNRHDMYLRSYGLLPSPELESESDKSAKISPLNSANTVNKQRTDVCGNIKPSQAQKILETPHGVKYTSSSNGLNFGRPWYDRTGLGSSASVRSHSNVQAAKETNTDNPSSYSLFYPHHKDLKPILRTPQSTNQVAQKPKTTTTDSSCVGVKYPLSSYGRSTGNRWNADNEIQSTDGNQEMYSEGSITFHDSKDKLVHHHPRPPSSTMTNGTNVSRYQSRRRLPKGSSDKSHASQNPNNTTTTSAVRMTDSPHGKLETMSRQEAREVVDFINKAMDPNILRTLVKSPGKETFRGSSGHSSYRHAPLHQYNEQTCHGDAGSFFNPMNNTINPKGNIGMPRVSNNSAHSRVGLHGPPSAGVNRLLPPVKPVVKKKRCFLCAKKTGLATSYTCRCGNNFCATHRYAETHDCTYDYKTRGRKLLEESNPLVSAPKLPKI